MAPETNSCSKILKVTQNNCSHLGMWRACKNTLKIVFFVRKNKKWLHAILQMTMRTGEYSTIVSWLLRGRLLILDSPLSQIIIYGNTLMLLNSKQEHTPEIRILVEKSDKCFKAVRWKKNKEKTLSCTEKAKWSLPSCRLKWAQIKRKLKIWQARLFWGDYGSESELTNYY